MRRLSMKGKSRKSETSASNNEAEENGGSVSNAGSIEDVKNSETMTKGKRRAAKNKNNSKETEDDTEVNSNDDVNTADEEITGSGDQENGNAKGAKRRKKEIKDKPTTSQQNNTEEDEENNGEYEVEKIVAHRTIKGRRQFLVRWKGYGEDSDTWEQEKDLSCPQLIDDFLADEESKQEAHDSVQKRNNFPKNKQPKTEKKEKKQGKSSSNRKDDNGLEHHDERVNDDEAATDDEKEYEVEKVIDVYFKKNKAREFLIRWKGFPSSADTWEPEENLNCQILIEKFMNKVEKAKASEPPELRTNPQHTKRYTLSMMNTGRRLSKRNMDKQRATYHECD